MLARCPHCQNTFSHVVSTEVIIHHNGKNLAGKSYNCPHAGCGFSLGVEQDPTAIGMDLIDLLVARLSA